MKITQQHAVMRIVCPHCQAVYRIAGLAPGAILVCHRCGTEFTTDTPSEEVSAVVADEQLSLFNRTSPKGRAATKRSLAQTGHAATPAADSHIADTESATVTGDDDVLTFPTRRAARIWPWLVGTLLLAASSGFIAQKDAWLDNIWLRSTLINLGLPVDVRDQDWLVMPESVRAQWLKRDDNSRVLVIEGRLANQLTCELPLPKIAIDFYADDAPDTIVRTELVTVTLPPDMQTIRHAPYRTPAVDDVPVAPRSERGFLLVLESLPSRIADFTLTAKAMQP